MSFFDDASLVMIPSGYKDQEVYSVKPTDGTGDLTFSRASDATRVASNGLIEKVRTNTLLQSETFDNATWSKQNSSVVSNSIAAPNGTTTADSLIPANGINVFSGVFVANTTPVVKTFSFYVKKGSKRYALLLGYTGVSNCWFDLDDGVVGTRGANFSASSITAVGNGWYRVSAVFSTAIGGLSNVGLYASDADNSEVCTGDGTTVALYLWGAQVETGDIATDYIPTTTAAVSVGPVSGLPRLDYLGSTCPRLLLEPQRTNLVTFSEQIDNAAYIKGQCSITANAATAPDGTLSADKIVEDTSNNPHVVYRGPTGAGATFSFFAKAAERNWVGVLSNNGNISFFNLANGTLGTIAATSTATITPYGNGWYRCTLFNTHATFGMSIYLATANGTESYTGNGTSGAYIWGCQLEASVDYATSYIPTLGASVTRVADAASKTGISSLIGQTEGTLFVEATLTHSAPSNEYLIQVSVDADNRFFIYREASTNKLGCFARVGASTIFNNVTASASTGTIKAAFAYKSGSFAFYVNGVQVAVSSSTYTTPASMGIFNLDSNAGAENGFYTYAQALLFKTRLTNSQLAELTA
jgi:hypothetical protein